MVAAIMRQDLISFDPVLAAATGDDNALLAELQAVFLESASRHALSLVGASSVAEWRDAAWRLKGCAASFGAMDVMAAADRAAAATVRDPLAIAAVAAALDALAT